MNYSTFKFLLQIRQKIWRPKFECCWIVHDNLYIAASQLEVQTHWWSFLSLFLIELQPIEAMHHKNTGAHFSC